MKLVLDTNIWISATLWNRSVAQKLLYKLLRENHEIYLTKEMIEEYISVLNKDFNIHDYNEYINMMTVLNTANLINRYLMKMDVLKKNVLLNNWLLMFILQKQILI
jgi:predicted nucleic acid-binding protein